MELYGGSPLLQVGYNISLVKITVYFLCCSLQWPETFSSFHIQYHQYSKFIKYKEYNFCGKFESIGTLFYQYIVLVYQ